MSSHSVFGIYTFPEKSSETAPPQEYPVSGLYPDTGKYNQNVQKR